MKAANAAAAAIAPGFPTGLAKPALRALQREGLESLKDLAKRTESDIAALHGMGPKALAMLRTGLAAHGLRYKRAAR